MAKVTATSEEREINVLTPGPVTLRVADCKETQTKNGHDMFKLVLKTDDPNTYVSDNLVFNEAAAWKVSQIMRSSGSTVVEGDDIELSPDDVIGLVVQADVIVKKHKGKDYNNIARYIVPGDNSIDDNGSAF